MTAVGSKGRTRGSALLDAVGVLAGAWWVQASNSLFPVYSPFESKLRKRGTMTGYRSIGVALTGAAAPQAEPCTSPPDLHRERQGSGPLWPELSNVRDKYILYCLINTGLRTAPL